ncbi:GNAT family protein [Tenacibaculum ovolyticum]|uniref:GNAT family N-acetyltransferase n=1 Tax=Tenacibaculum ovolyticum TaxID=104270 RepID=UPI0022F3D5C2|nr:GNAT family protein [Tenacibaculum ovolyticum]WBX75421.1 GNAT family protein [Tenacibaculum ovolyticum]
MIKLEPFTENDFENLISWIDSERESVQFSGSIFSYPLTKNQLEDYLTKEDLIPKKIVDAESGEVIGHCELNFLNEFPRLARILIGNKKYKGKGLGKLLITLMINEIQSIKTANKIELRVFEWNKNAVKLYENVGFKIQHKSTFKFKYNNNELWTNLYMLKTFNEK